MKRFDEGAPGLYERPFLDYHRYVDHEREQRDARLDALDEAALIADKVEATARPGGGKDAAAEIGRRIRALKEEHNGQPLY